MVSHEESAKAQDCWLKSVKDCMNVTPRNPPSPHGTAPQPLARSCLPYVVAVAVITAIVIPIHLTFQSSPGLLSLVWSNGAAYQPPPLGWTGRLFTSLNGFDAALCRADAIYWENLARRKVALNGALQPQLPNPVAMKELVLIPTYPCPINERIGKWGDGGKWTCLLPNAIQKRKPVVYSIGSFGMYSFEKRAHEIFGVKPHTFDPFLPPDKLAIMRSLTFLHFHEIGLSSAKSLANYKTQFPGVKFSTLPDMMRALGHSYVDVFKIDCEGCEEDWVRSLGTMYRGTGNKLALHGGNLPFGQILIELHNMQGSFRTLNTFYTLENLGYRMFSIEYNPYCPRCVEMSFIHESLVRPADDVDCRPFLTRAAEEGEGGKIVEGGAAVGGFVGGTLDG